MQDICSNENTCSPHENLANLCKRKTTLEETKHCTHVKPFWNGQFCAFLYDVIVLSRTRGKSSFENAKCFVMHKKDNVRLT